MKALYMKYKEVADDRFRFVIDFGIKVPKTYSHHHQVRDFRSRFDLPDEGRVYKIEDGFNDISLAHPSFRLVADRYCLVAIFQVARSVSCDEALGFLRMLGADLVGGQGTTLLWPQAKAHIPQVRRVVSLDVRENLPTAEIVRSWRGPYTVDRKIGVPYIFRYSGDDVGFHFDPFDEGLSEKHCLACFKQEGQA